MYDSHLRRARKPAELLLVPMIDIFTVLVTFLLMTAVFARITVLQLDLPSAADGNSAEPTFRLEVIVRKDGLELTNGATQIATLPTTNGKYDLKTLSDFALSLKREYPDVDSASVLMEPDVEYDNLIQVMDAIRSRETPAASPAGETGTGDQQTADESGEVTPTRVALFTRIAVGDAP
jgi:biopolymer transport protein ExbD